MAGATRTSSRTLAPQGPRSATGGIPKAASQSPPGGPRGSASPSRNSTGSHDDAHHDQLVLRTHPRSSFGLARSSLAPPSTSLSSPSRLRRTSGRRRRRTTSPRLRRGGAAPSASPGRRSSSGLARRPSDSRPPPRPGASASASASSAFASASSFGLSPSRAWYSSLGRGRRERGGGRR